MKSLNAQRISLYKTQTNTPDLVYKPLFEQSEIENNWDYANSQSESLESCSEVIKQRQLRAGAFPTFTKDLQPINVHLRTKNTRSCYKCEKVLVKPEVKTDSTAFVVAELAYTLLPRLEIVAFDSLNLLYVKIINPTCASVVVYLSSKLKLNKKEIHLLPGKDFTITVTINADEINARELISTKIVKDQGGSKTEIFLDWNLISDKTFIKLN